MAYRKNMSDEELKEELVFLSLGTAESFEFWLEDFDWRLAPYDHCILVDAVVGYFVVALKPNRLGIMLAKIRALHRKNVEEDGFLSGIIL